MGEVSLLTRASVLVQLQEAVVLAIILVSTLYLVLDQQVFMYMSTRPLVSLEDSK